MRKFFIPNIFLILTLFFVTTPLLLAQDETITKAETLHQEAIKQARDGKLTKALSLIEQSHSLAPTDKTILADYIIILGWNGRYTKAIELFEKNPNETWPDYLKPEIARSYRLTGEYQRAIDLYEPYLKDYPKDEEAFRGLIYSLLGAERYQEAESLIQEYAAKAPTSSEYWKLYLRVLLSEGKWQQVFAVAEKMPSDQNETIMDVLKSTTDWKLTREKESQIGLSLMRGAKTKGLNTAQAAFVLKYLHDFPPTKEEAKELRSVFAKQFNQYPISLQLDIGEFFDTSGLPQIAEKFYADILKKSPDNATAALWMAKWFYKHNNKKRALSLVEQSLKKVPSNIDALFLKGQLLEDEEEYIKAIAVYEKIQKLYPDNEGANNLKNRALMDLGANSLALENLQKDKRADPVLLQRARGNQAMYAIRWQEPKRALAIIDKELKRYQKQNEVPSEKKGVGEKTKHLEAAQKALNQLNDSKSKAERQKQITAAMREAIKKVRARAKKGSGSGQYGAAPAGNKTSSEEEKHYWRERWDKILALRLQQKMLTIIQEYEEIQKEGVNIPFWIKEAAADAYLYERQPEKALAIYQEVLKEKPDNYNTKMAIYHTLVELGRFKDAEKILDELDAKEPVRVYERGILRDNWRKADIAYNRAWLLLYQDRLAEAQKYINSLMKRASFDTNLRTALAQTKYYRGWPRHALEEFQISRTMEPNDIVANNGYCLVLNDNMKKKEAREYNRKLLKKYPKNKHVQRVKRQFDVEEMTLLTLDAYFTQEFPGVDEAYFSVRIDQPVGFHHTLFAQGLRRETIQEGDNDLIHRVYVGDIWRPNNRWQWTASISQEVDTGDNFGWALSTTFTPDDYWTFSAGYDSYLLSVPLRSREAGTDVTETSFSMAYRASELFNTSISVALNDYTDGNENMSYLWTTDTALTTKAYWKTRLGTEFYVGTNTRPGVDYYSPKYIYSFYIIPMVEHTWYRRYEKAMVDRLYVGIGQQWQKEYPNENVGYIRYEQDYRFSDTLSWLIGTVYSLNNYDGADVNTWNIYSTLRKRF